MLSIYPSPPLDSGLFKSTVPYSFFYMHSTHLVHSANVYAINILFEKFYKVNWILQMPCEAVSVGVISIL